MLRGAGFYAMKDALADRLTLLLVRLGFARRTWAWKLLYAVSPSLAGLVAITDRLLAPSEQLLWVWPGPEHETSDDEIAGILAAISEEIDRAPTPMGGDEYRVFIASYGALPGEKQGIDLDDPTLPASISRRRPVETVALGGSRWHDWKHGQGKDRILDVLRQMTPGERAPVTTIRIMVEGKVAAETVQNMT